MKLRCVSVGLGIVLLFLGAVGCSEATPDTAQAATTTVPQPPSTTTTTLSPQQVMLADMTPRQKAAQVLLLTFSGKTLTDATADLLAAGPPGGLLILGHNVEDPTQMQTLTASLQRSAAASGLPVGLFIAVDEEGGTVQRIKEGVPNLISARKLGEGSTPYAVSELARMTALGLLVQGINMNLAPVADVVDDDSSFLYKRTYSGDPAVVSEYVTAVIEASQGQGLISVVKHFPGHGSAAGNTHTEDAVSGATEQDFESVHLPPFRAAIAAGVEGVMVAHIVAAPYDPKNPASISQAVIEGLLREQLGFQGLVITDDISMAPVLATAAAPTPQQEGVELTEDEILIAKEVAGVVAALNAGCDLVILTELETRSKAVLDGLVSAIEQGAVSQHRLDEAVLNILETKYQHSILAPEIPPADAVTSTTATTETEEPEQ